jgi:ABC-type amino acid transport substrate-binding protein
MLAGAHTFALALLIGGAVAGLLELRRAAMIRYILITGLLLIVSLGGLRLLYEYGLPSEYEQDERFRSMDLAAEPVALTVREKLPRGDAMPGSSRLDQVVARGVLRVGYLADSLPNVFVNSESELVGLDVDLASLMARDIGVDLEFVRVPSLDEAGAALDAGSIDIMMSGLSVTPGRMLDMHFSEPYMRATMSFVVRDHVRAKFSSREAVQALKKPKIGVLDTPYYIETLRSYLPQAEIVKLGSPGDFFRQRSEELDALFLTAERGSAWTLLYPEFSVAVPQPDVLAAPVAIGVARSADALADFINAWLRLKREDKTIDQLYRHWILGGGAKPREPRWSVIRDVLGWVD